MAIVTRYFSTTSAGGRTGAAWADRAMLFPSNIAVNSGTWSAAFTPGETITQTGTGATAVVELAGGSGVVFHVSSTSGSPNTTGVWTGGTSGSTVTPTAVPVANQWSRVITGFDFSGSDSLECRVEGAVTYTCSQTLASGLFTSAPTVATPLSLHGCDNAGAELATPDWVAASGALTHTSFPAIETTVTVSTLSFAVWRLMRMTTASNITLLSQSTSSTCDMLSLESSGTATILIATIATNCDIIATGANIGTLLNPTSYALNCRCKGNSGATTGDRRGILIGSGFVPAVVSHCVVIDCVQQGIVFGTSGTGAHGIITNCVVNGSSTGITRNNTASQTVWWTVRNCYVANSAAYLIDAQSNGYLIAMRNRVRDFTSDDFFNMKNYPQGFGNITAVGTDADEYVDLAGTDLRMKNTSTYWGKNIGAGDQPAAGSGGGMIGGGNLSGGFQ